VSGCVKTSKKYFCRTFPDIRVGHRTSAFKKSPSIADTSRFVPFLTTLRVSVFFGPFFLVRSIQKILLHHSFKRFSSNISRVQPNRHFSCDLVAVRLSFYQRHVLRYRFLPQNSKMGLLSRFSYPSFFSIRQGGSIGTIFEKLRDRKLEKLRQKYFLDVLPHTTT